MTAAKPYETRPWRVANDLALDAALAALAWQWALWPVAGGPSWAASAVLGLSVWLVYMGDRWLDVRSQAPTRLPTQRHRFTARHRGALLALWLVVLAVNVSLAWLGLTPAQFNAGLVLLGLSIAYTAGIQRHVPRRVTKELQVALIFAAGVGVFCIGLSMGPVDWQALALFAVICFINCALLAKWEMPADRAMGRASLALALGARVSWIARSALIVGLLGLAMGWLKLAAGVLGVYSLALFAMDAFQWPANPEDRRCLADGLLAALGLVATLLT